MNVNDLLPWLTILIAFLGFSKWLAGVASKLTEAITNLNASVEKQAESFNEFKTEAKGEHKEVHRKLDDHEIRIHSLEDWKKTKEERK